MSIEDYGKYLSMMNQWLILKQEGKNIDRFIKAHGWREIAVYGMAIYGRHVIRELKESDCRVVYAIDRKKLVEYEGVKILQPVELLPEVDVVINSVIHEHDNIAGELRNVVSCPVVSLETVVFESY